MGRTEIGHRWEVQFGEQAQWQRWEVIVSIGYTSISFGYFGSKHQPIDNQLAQKDLDLHD